MNQAYYRVVIHIEADEVTNSDGKYDHDPENVERFSEFFGVREGNIIHVEWLKGE